MNKKFLSALLFGAVVAASTSTFVSCKDYDDDIDALQEQITTQSGNSIAAEVTAKFNAVNAEITALKNQQAALQNECDEAKEELSSAIQAAKAEAIEAASAKVAAAEAALALTNQAVASLESAVAAANARIDAANAAANTANQLAQAAKDAAAANAAAIAADQVKIAGLVDADAKLQTAVETAQAKADQAYTLAEKAATKEALAEVVASLDAVESKLQGEIDAVAKKAIDNEAAIEAQAAIIESIKASNQEAVEALKSVDAELAAELAANATKIAETQATIEANKLAAEAALAAAKAELEGKVAEVITSITGLEAAIKVNADAIAANAADIDAVELLIAGIDGDIEGIGIQVSENSGTIKRLQDQINVLIGEMNEKYEGLGFSLEELNAQINRPGGIVSQINTLIGQVGELEEQVNESFTALSGKIDRVAAEADAMFGSVNEKADALAEQVAANTESISGNADAIADIKATLQTLTGSTTGSFAAIEEAYKKADEALAAQISNIGKIAAGNADALIRVNQQLTAINKSLEDVLSRIDEVNKAFNAIVKRIQSVVFVPEYQSANGNPIVPVYTIANNYATEAGRRGAQNIQYPTINMKFRVQPAECAKELAAVLKYSKTEGNYIKVLLEEAMETRVADANKVVINSVTTAAEEGVIVVNATANLKGEANYPATLMIGSTLTTDEKGELDATSNAPLRITTDYFTLDAKNYRTLSTSITSSHNVKYTNTDTHTPASQTVKEAATGDVVSVANGWGYNPNLAVYSARYVEGGVVKTVLASNTDRTNGWNAKFVTYAKSQGFVVSGTDACTFVLDKNANGTAMYDKIGNSITFILVDKVHGYDVNGVPAKTYLVTYTITGDNQGGGDDFGTYTRQWNGSAYSAAFTVDCVKDNNDDTMLFPNEVKIGNYTVNNTLVATADEMTTELAANAASAVYTYKVGGNYVALPADVHPTISFTGKKAYLTVTFDAGAEYKKYEMKIEVNTKFGKITYTATADLSYNTSKVLAHEPRFSDGNFNVEAGNQIANGGSGYVHSNISKAYTNFDWATTNGVSYTFDILYKETKDARDVLTTNNGAVTYDPATHELVINKVPVASKVVNGETKTFTGAQYVFIKVTAKVNGDVCGEEIYGINCEYPIAADAFTTKALSFTKTQLQNATNGTVSVIAGTAKLVDIYGNALYENGVAKYSAYTNGNPAPGSFALGTKWGVSDLKYTLVSAKANGQDVSSVTIAANGDLTITDPNIGSNVTVTVKVETVGYYYAPVSATFDVVLDATK